MDLPVESHRLRLEGELLKELDARRCRQARPGVGALGAAGPSWPPCHLVPCSLPAPCFKENIMFNVWLQGEGPLLNQDFVTCLSRCLPSVLGTGHSPVLKMGGEIRVFDGWGRWALKDGTWQQPLSRVLRGLSGRAGQNAGCGVPASPVGVLPGPVIPGEGPCPLSPLPGAASCF